MLLAEFDGKEVAQQEVVQRGFGRKDHFDPLQTFWREVDIHYRFLLSNLYHFEDVLDQALKQTYLQMA